MFTKTIYSQSVSSALVKSKTDVNNSGCKALPNLDYVKKLQYRRMTQDHRMLHKTEFLSFAGFVYGNVKCFQTSI